MKIDWSAHFSRSLYLVIGTGLLTIVWIYQKWPGANLIRILFLLLTSYGALAGYFFKREWLSEIQRRKQLRDEIRSLCDDLSLQYAFSIDDFDLLYEVEELEQIIALLKAMPISHRRLQVAVDSVEEQSQ
jgi:hypothetical protein